VVEKIFGALYLYAQGKQIETEEEHEALVNLFDSINFLLGSDDQEVREEA